MAINSRFLTCYAACERGARGGVLHHSDGDTEEVLNLKGLLVGLWS
jgi:hypothetical protein